jgi:stage III sporulation protein AC
MSIDVIFRIAGIGILVAVIAQLLKQTGREELATIATIAGLVITLLMVIDLISGLFDNVRRVFELY